MRWKWIKCDRADDLLIRDVYFIPRSPIAPSYSRLFYTASIHNSFAIREIPALRVQNIMDVCNVEISNIDEMLQQCTQ